MTVTEALPRLAQVIHKDARHPWYQRTTSLASLYRKLVTGDGLDDLLQQFVKREDAEAFNQRKQYTKHVVTTVTKNLMDVMRKVPRASYQRVLIHDKEEPTKRLEAIAAKFWGARSVDDWVKTRWLELNAVDPNTFLVVEIAPFDNTTQNAQGYPFEVDSYSAVDFAYQNNVLQYLTVKSAFAIPDKRGKDKVGEKYTVYLDNETFTVTELPENQTPNIAFKDGEYTESSGVIYFHSRRRTFQVETFTPHGLGEVPAQPVGYLRDQWTSGNTYVAPYDAAVPLLEKSIKVNSETDLTMGLSAFPFRLEYAPPCDAEGCYNGYLSDGNGMCGACKGTGHKSVVSAQEKLVLTLPKPGTELMDLEKLVVFKSPPVDILDFQVRYIDGLTDRCKTAMFNSDLFTKQQVSETATGQRIDLDNVYDTLFDCAMGFAETWEFMIRMCAKYAQLDKGLRAELIFGKDFKLKGLSDLLADLDAANRSEAGAAVKQNVQTEIARLMYADNPRDFLKWETMERYNPFAGYSEMAAANALSDPAVPVKYKLLYQMLGVVFDELEFEATQKNQDFYLLPEDKQRELIWAKVAEYQGQTAPAPRLPLNVN